MLYLVLTVLLNTMLAVIFKIFPRYRIDALQAIVVNYCVCVITGSLFLGHFPIEVASMHQSWAPFALLTGIGFVSVFNLFAYCTRITGITTSSIANKLSLVIPVLFALALYGDVMTPAKGLGIFLAFPAVYLSTRVTEDGNTKSKLHLPALLFLGSGLMDTLVNFVTRRFFLTGDAAADAAGVQLYLIHGFAIAGMLGLLLLGVLFLLRKAVFRMRNIWAGIILGVPNYFSMYYFLKLLNSRFLQSSAAIPVTNIATVLCAALCAIFLFRERAAWPRLIGLALSVTAILLIALSDLHARTA